MAHVLNIVHGSTTITLASGACSLLAYVPRAPTSLEEDATIAEPCKIEISGSNVADLQTALQSIELAFRQAERYRDYQLGDRVYLEFTPDGYSDTYRSELLTGKPDFDSNTLDDRWVEKKIDVTLNWTRRFFWEGPQVGVVLSNGSGSSANLPIYNHDDGGAGHDNWGKIEAADVTGNLPTPPIITLNNNYASGDLLDIYLAHNFHSTPQYLINTFEAEDATGGTPTADAACSGGNYNSVSWTATTETQLLSFDLGDADTEYALGNFFKIMMRFQTAPAYTNCWLRFKMLFGSTVVWAGPLTLLNSRALQDCGIIQWPPGGDFPLNMSGLTLNLYAKRNSAGTHTLKIDFMQLLALDGFRFIKGTASIANGERLIDNGVIGKTYKASAGNLAYHTHDAIGFPIMLQPGKLQKIHVLQVESSGAAPIERTALLSVSYRPRRTAL